jgi:hypothetical protein
MDATLFTGTGTTQTINNAASFRPDIVWVKSIATVAPHYNFDVVQGTGIYMSMNDSPTNTYTNANTLTSFNSNGFTLGSGTTGLNANADPEVAWQWQAGATPVTNTDGATTTTVRVNRTAGCSIVTYTGTGSLTTIGHGLGEVPKLIFSRPSPITNNFNWQLYHGYGGGTSTFFPASTAATNPTTATWNSTNPTSTVYTVNFSGGTNTTDYTYISWVFSDVEGFSRFWAYTGNGNPDGPFIYLGFRPKFIMIKRFDSTGDWVIKDTSRSPYNVTQQSLKGNLTAAQVNEDPIDIVSNGFKIKHSAATGNLNTSGGVYIYAAWAENPFKNANAR